jgi:hypothetical protein
MNEDLDTGGIDRDRSLLHQCFADAPATLAVLEANPSLGPRIFSGVPSGWDSAVAQALSALAHLSAETGVEIVAVQIKSKFGSLRIYVDIEDDSVGVLEEVKSTPVCASFRASALARSVRERATAIVRAAAVLCAKRCERCGADAELVNKNGWLVTACPTHGRTSNE